MSNRRRYNEEQQAEMVKAYGGGMTLNDVAGMFGCSPMTVSAYVRHGGGKVRPKSKGQRSRLPILAIMKDWNEGMSPKEICEKHDIKSVALLYDRAARWRRVGYPFKTKKQRRAIRRGKNKV